MNNQITPHGGTLINRIVREEEREAFLEKALKLPAISLSEREASDLEMIATGAFSPLEGFMGSEVYESVLEVKRLPHGLAWTIPVTLSLEKIKADKLKIGAEVALLDGEKKPLGILHLEEKYPHDKEREAVLVYGTKDRAHPGVDKVYKMGDVLLGGKIEVIHLPKHNDFLKHRLSPLETRKIFKEKGWRRIAAFQTRNPIHRAHEYIQKCALEIVDGLFLHPLVGETKATDIPADIRIKSYEVVLEKYYPRDRYLMGVLPMAMRYAGPREAILHAIVRKNYGATHFIVGRDHAGAGNFYGPFDAHYIFDEYEPEELGITPLFFDNAFYCKQCQGMASYKTCPHESSEHISLSGTRVRSILKEKKRPPRELTRPEVADILIEGLSRPNYQI